MFFVVLSCFVKNSDHYRHKLMDIRRKIKQLGGDSSQNRDIGWHFVTKPGISITTVG